MGPHLYAVAHFFDPLRGLALNIFGKLGRFVKRVFNLSMTDPKAWDRSLWNLYGSQSMSGEVVTEETALTYAAVWNAVTLISGTIGSLPLHLMRPDGRNKKQATEQTLYQVLHTKYNPYMTAMAGRECMMAHILTWGNGYAEIVRNGYGEVVELWPIPPDRVSPKMQDKELVYDIRLPDGSTITLKRVNILHIPGVGFDGFVGYSIIEMARKSIGLGMAMETFGSLHFKNGIHPGAVVTHPHAIQDEKAFKQALNESYGGLGNSHRLMLLEEGMDIKFPGLKPEDSQFIQSKQHHISDIARWFNLQPHKLKDLTKSSFNNIEEENASYLSDTILPWLIRCEQNYQMQLLTPAELKQGFYFKHIFEGLLRAKAADRAAFYKAMFCVGMSMNQILEKEDLPLIDNEFADVPWIPMNMIPVTMVREYLEKNTSEKAGQEPEQTSPAVPAPVTEEIEEGARDKVLKLIAPKKEM